MSTIEEKLRLLLKTKTDIMYALKSKGVDITPDTPFSEYDVAVKAVQGGDVLLLKTLEELASKGDVAEGTLALVYDVDTDVFQGLFEFTDTWQVINNQLTADANTIAPGYVGFGHNGIVEGNFTNDADATANDILNPATAYVAGRKLTGAIQCIYEDLENVIVSNSFEQTADFLDIRRDLGYALQVSGSSLNIYKINEFNEFELVTTYTISMSGYTFTDCRFARSPFYIDSESKVINIFASYTKKIVDGKYNHIAYYQTLRVIRFDMNSDSMYSSDTLSTSVVYDHNIKGYYDDWGTAATPFCIPITDTKVMFVAKTWGADNQKYGDYQITPTLYQIQGNTVSRVLTTAHAPENGGYNGIAFTSNTGRLYISASSSGRQLIGSFNAAFTTYTTRLNETTWNSYKACLIDDMYLYNDKLYDSEGGLLHTYTSSIFNNNANFKAYCNGFIFEFSTSNQMIYQYSFNRDTFAITYVRAISNQPLTGISFGSNSVKAHPRTVSEAVTYWGSTQSKYYEFYSDALSKELKAVIRDGIKYIYPKGSNLISSNNLLTGYSSYGPDGKIIGTMPNNGALNVTPTQQAQSFSKGYYSGITVGASVFEDHTEYDTCLALTTEILA